MAKKVSIIIAVFNKLKLTKESLKNLSSTVDIPYELIIIDNGSSDGTSTYIEDLSCKIPITYIRNNINMGLIKAYNKGIKLSNTEFICFLHNDILFKQVGWLEEMIGIMESNSGIGLAGVYGAKKIKKTGRTEARTTVHDMHGEGRQSLYEHVAVVDGVCMLARRSLVEEIGGFDENYGLMHGYDRDMSLSLISRGYRNIVVMIPFEHKSGSTRHSIEYRNMVGDDILLRKRNFTYFVSKWRHRIPYDVRSRREKVFDHVSYMVKNSSKKIRWIKQALYG